MQGNTLQKKNIFAKSKCKLMNSTYLATAYYKSLSFPFTSAWITVIISIYFDVVWVRF